jgi:hypothetical protein
MRFKVMPRPLSAPPPPPPPTRWLVYLESDDDSRIVEFTDYAEAMRHAQEESRRGALSCVEVADCLGRIVWSHSAAEASGVPSGPI